MQYGGLGAAGIPATKASTMTTVIPNVLAYTAPIIGATGAGGVGGLGGFGVPGIGKGALGYPGMGKGALGYPGIGAFGGIGAPGIGKAGVGAGIPATTKFASNTVIPSTYVATSPTAF